MKENKTTEIILLKKKEEEEEKGKRKNGIVLKRKTGQVCMPVLQQ